MIEVFTKVLPKSIIHTMTYSTILTSKGTTTIPKVIRDDLGMATGSVVLFMKNELTGQYEIKKPLTLAEVRKANKEEMIKAGTMNFEYESGDGYGAMVDEKYGNRL
jgi:bifunctional DNA-binding transcriptional regulator/antitoxin component of YhaV-PrlF toxin-antitoxin module